MAQRSDPPEVSAALDERLSRDVSPDERMPVDNLDVYFDVGRSALRAIQLAQELASVSGFTSILDMPCGHGRVARWLRAAYPAARLTACDLLTDGVDYCARTFDARPVHSTMQPDASMFDDTYDLIFVGSLLTHVDADRWDRFIDLWWALLRPGGLLIVTTHGDYVAERMRGGELYGYPPLSIERLLRTYAHARFGFLEESPGSIDYGITVSKPDWVLHRLLRCEGARVVLYSERLWDRHQDVAAIARPANALSTLAQNNQRRPRFRLLGGRAAGH
ncbi:MAG: class I SAM-dependent methyltransferase [Candidatus Dormibacteraeota bacterium]|nr:class I SAM-dependent methyltransferase [Candidatus Dormibacteraeota bacterium]